MIKAVLDHIDTHSNRARTFWFKPSQTINYTAGQFTELYLPHKDTDAHGNKRWFTLSSSPTEPLIAITTRFPDKLSSFKRALKALVPGDAVTMAEAMGDFVLPKGVDTPLIFIAAGIGATPMRSMVRWLIDSNEERPITLLYSAHDKDDLLFLDTFNSYGLNPRLYLSAENKRLTSQDILPLINDDSLAYISGPERMVETLRNSLIEKGINPSQVVGDYFPGYENTA